MATFYLPQTSERKQPAKTTTCLRASVLCRVSGSPDVLLTAILNLRHQSLIPDFPGRIVVDSQLYSGAAHCSKDQEDGRSRE